MANTDAQIAQWNDIISNDPVLQGLFEKQRNPDHRAELDAGYLPGGSQIDAIHKRLGELGISVPKGQWISGGQIKDEKSTDWILPALLAAGVALPLVAPGVFGAAGAGAGTAGSLATPALTSGLPTGLSAGSMTAAELAGSAVPGVVSGAGTAAGGGGGILSKVGKYAGQLSGIGEGINAATDQAAQNRMAQNDPYMQRARLDDTERATALRDLYSINRSMNPTSSPFNPRPAEAPTGAMRDTLQSLFDQNSTRLKAGSTYDATKLPSLQAGTLEKVGQWAGPVLSTVGKVAKMF